MSMTGTSNQATNPKIKSFLESLRNQSTSKPTSNESFPNAGFSLENFQEKKRLEVQRKSEFFAARKKEFNEVYSAKKRQEKNKIEEIHRQLKALAQSMKRLKKEVDVAVEQAPIEVGEYQFSFLEHLQMRIELLKRDTESSSTWLHMFNSRSKKKGYYWAMSQSKGTKFTMSEERGLATSIG